MSLRALWTAYDLDFTFEAVTSRERMRRKRTYFVRVWHEEQPQVCGLGECGLFRGLSADDCPEYEDALSQWCSNPEAPVPDGFPSIRFGAETALLDLAKGGGRRLFDSPWTAGLAGLPTNGLIWMGDRATMAARIEEKLAAGFHVLKLKIGGIAFEEECALLADIRRRFPADRLELRLDANGSLGKEAMRMLERLAKFAIHSIEQPIAAGNWPIMADICRNSPIPIALDEELIGISGRQRAVELLDELRPQYIILKPTLIGGLEACDLLIREAEERSIGWWVTSALESNVGLNAIAQWAATKEVRMPQGLGTGQLYSNNIASPLRMRGEQLWYDPCGLWQSPETFMR